MSQTGLTQANLEVGENFSSAKAIAINDAINDNDTRLTAAEGSLSRVQVMNDAVTGFISQYTVDEIGSFQTFTAPTDITLTTLQMTITDNFDNSGNSDSSIPFETSTTGVLEITMELLNETTDVWGSILSVNPSIPTGSNGRGTSSNNATFATADIDSGQTVRIRPLRFKDQQGSFHIECTAEAR